MQSTETGEWERELGRGVKGKARREWTAGLEGRAPREQAEASEEIF